MLIYRVKEGETLQDIARRFGVRADKISADSNCSCEQVDAGIYLLIRRPEGREYVVKPFDTLGDIAERFGVSEDGIIKNNRLTSSELFIGQKLYIPTRIA